MTAFRKILLSFLFASGALVVYAQQPKPNNLRAGFQNPASAARPRVWWHWMNGNITKDGIRKDLLWMHRSGIAGFQNFDAGLTTPQIVEKRLTYMTPDWKDAFRFTTKLADSLKLEMAIAGSPGWSESGGPWVPAKDGMKKLVWREIRVKGGQNFNGSLPKPPATTGSFQNLPIPEEASVFTAKTAPPPEYYEDVAVIAYRLPTADLALTELNPKVSSSAGSFTLTQLTDGDLNKTNLLPSDANKGYAWIQFEFTKPQTIKAITVVGGGSKSPFGLASPSENRSLEVSSDGINFKQVAFIPLTGVPQQTITIPATTAKFYRVTFKNPPPPFSFAALEGGEVPKPPAGTDIAEIMLHPVPRVNHLEEKAGFATATDLTQHPTPPTTEVISEANVIDITGKMGQNGTLNWTPPAGEWKIVRFGYSLTGKKNHPASPEATGLEVDKLDARAVKDYFENYLNQYKEATGGLMGSQGLQFMVTDSYESGQETWTPLMTQEFEKRRGYSLLTWMPVLTGAIVKSAEASDQFLWDFRQTIAELIAENHYDQLTTILEKYGMKRYTESHENGRVFIGDGMDVKRTAAVPMSAIWIPGIGGSSITMAQADIRESASVAHIYGQNLAAAESLTAIGLGGKAWSYSPEQLKPTADLELANGLNRFVIHTSVHQPVDDKIPGLGLGPFGQWFNRHETWSDQAKAWTDYLARNSYLLQQGKFVADVVYYYGEDNNITGLFGNQLPAIPEGYNYDFINPHALLNLLSVKDGKLVTPSGMSYQVLYLDNNARHMSLKILRKIAHLVKAGATISGVKPENTPSLKDDKQEFQRLVNEIWNSGNPKVMTGKELSEVLPALNIAPDFTYTKPQNDTKILYVHRQLPDGEIYWVNNRSDRFEKVEASFRVSGRIPQIWHPETGKTEPTSYQTTKGRTAITLNLTPNDAVFVIFQEPTTKSSFSLTPTSEKEIVTVAGNWQVTFQPNRGAPAGATFNQLTSYTENPEAGIKYFSGTATYNKTVTIPTGQISKGSQIWLDLGEVKNLAEIIVNGKSLGIVWKKPFRVDATNALKAGNNKVEVKVTNLWVNRLIGDQQTEVKQKITYTTMPFYQANSELLPAGLLGPVKVLSVK
ncbi:glycoside hydrolase [Adhaeribacter arboris]|uniref:Glycoside hydrolase n=1 Tax=Adhaeribacter arboris TaxID=2072846 RepID=A0A2T2YD47_9BACT|nr:glycosyl hydrolase [Adhaeribacter arboris]PSR53423.1 glycoside hydrolase [Adhaeribacter arboris]